VVIDGVPGAHFDRLIFDPIFSQNSKRIAYYTLNQVIVDGEVSPKFDDMLPPEFSPDSGHVIYSAKKDGKWAIMLDGKAGPSFSDSVYAVFSPDSSRLAQVTRNGRIYTVGLDGQTGPQLTVWSGHAIRPVFSGDSKHFAYCGMAGRDFVTVIDGKILPGNNQYPVFSPDSLHTAWVARSESGKWAIVLDKSIGPEFGDVKQPVFSTDSKHLASFAKDGKDEFAILDGQHGPGFDRILDAAESVPHFNLDGSITYVAVRGGMAYTVTQSSSVQK
jgi:hypothetical protein